MTEQLQRYSGEVSNIPTTILSYFSILVPPQKCKVRDKDFLSEKASQPSMYNSIKSQSASA